MAILYDFAARCLFGVVFLHKAKQGRWLCAVSTHKSLPLQRTAYRFTMKVPIVKVRSLSYLSPSSWVLRCVFCGKFFWMFLVLGNLTCAQEPRWLRVACRSSNWIIPNTAYEQSVDYLRVVGSMFFNAILITRFWKYWILPCARFKLWHDCYLIWQWYAQTNEYHRYIWPSEAYNWTNKNDSHLCNFNWCNIY